MFRELFQELFFGPDPTIAAQVPTGKFDGHFFLDRFIGTICLGIGWGVFLKTCRTRTKWLHEGNPNYVYFRNRNLPLNDSLKSMLSGISSDINHLSPDFFKYGFMPYQFVSRDDYRLGEAEWRYDTIQPPSQITASGHLDDVPGIHAVEFEYFEKAMAMCGQFKISELRRMFRHAVKMTFEPKEMMCEIGDPDIYMLLVIKGEIEVVVVNEDRRATTIRIAQRGDRVMSLFSFIDVLTGNARPLRSIEIFSRNYSQVVKFPIPVIKDFLHCHPQRLLDVVRRVVRKIHEINFLMLHRILGLTLDLVHQKEADETQQKRPAPVEDPYPIPDPKGELPDEVREDAIRSLMQFLRVPEESFSLFDDCPVFLLDADPTPKDPNHEDEDIIFSASDIGVKPPIPPIVDNKIFKFKYLFKGKVEMYRLESELRQEDRSSEIADDMIINDALSILYPGEGLGGLATFAEADGLLHMRIKGPSIVVTLTEDILTKIFEHYPETVYPIANQILVRLSPVLRRMDFGLEWAIATSGKALFMTGNEVKDTYVVLGGRLRSYLIDPKGKLSFYGEYERGDWIGLVEALVKCPVRSKTVIAIRDTEVCKIPMDFISFLKANFPTAAFSLLNYMVHRVGRYRFHTKSLKLGPEEQLIAGTSRRCASLALIPTSEEIPYIPFAIEIKKHHDVFGKTAVLSYDTISKVFEIRTITHAFEYSVETWVMSILEDHDLVVFVCSKENQVWNEICIRHSETVVSLGLQGDPLGITPIERIMLGQDIFNRKRKELVILHKNERSLRKDNYALPRDTIAWLEQRPWLHCHHHIRIPAEAFGFVGPIPDARVYAECESLHRKIDKHSDMGRYCRWVMGKSTGVVFTSGGARMAVQLGIFRAMIEHDIPIDMVGGVGNGLIIAALYSIYQDIDRVDALCKEMFEGINDAYKTPFDFTIPYISPVQGRALLALVEKTFARTRMEDTWIPFFAVTCDISKQDARVHRDGPFWIYIRASLSNFTQAPPICDPKDGGYIVDGSFANPIPEDVMRDFGAEYVLVINTSVGQSFEPPKLDLRKDIFTNIWRLFLQVMSRLNFATPDVARINDMIARTQKVMYSEAVEANTDGLFVAFIRPDMEKISYQRYQDYRRLCFIGYKYAETILHTCPLKSVPFHDFWLNLRQTSSRLENEQGRGFTSNINDEFWDKMEGRIFERDDKIQEINDIELKTRLGSNFRGKIYDLKDIQDHEANIRLFNKFKDFIIKKHQMPTDFKGTNVG